MFWNRSNVFLLKGQEYLDLGRKNKKLYNIVLFKPPVYILQGTETFIFISLWPLGRQFIFVTSHVTFRDYQECFSIWLGGVSAFGPQHV